MQNKKNLRLREVLAFVTGDALRKISPAIEFIFLKTLFVFRCYNSSY